MDSRRPIRLHYTHPIPGYALSLERYVMPVQALYMETESPPDLAAR